MSTAVFIHDFFSVSIDKIYETVWDRNMPYVKKTSGREMLPDGHKMITGRTPTGM